MPLHLPAAQLHACTSFYICLDSASVAQFHQRYRVMQLFTDTPKADLPCNQRDLGQMTWC
jgi:hypothetical protein